MTQTTLSLQHAIVPLNGLTGLHNLQTVYSLSTPWEKEDGLAYYANTHNKIAKIAHDAHIPSQQAFGAFAALSPNNDEASNYIDLIACIKGHQLGTEWKNITVRTYDPNRVKAMLILTGEEPMRVLGGNKVRNFYCNLLDPTDRHPVTVDGHMVSVWNGKRLRLARKGEDSAVIRSNEHYNVIANDIRLLADALHMIPCQLQSILWLTWKRWKRIVYQPQLRFEFPIKDEDW